MRLLTWVALAAALLSLGCGHRGAPKPPLPRVPLTPEGVQWRQRGDVLEFNASYRLEIAGGRELRGTVRPIVLAYTAPAPERAQGWSTPSRDREFLRVAKRYELPVFSEVRHGALVPRVDQLPLESFGEGAGVVLSLALADERRHSRPTHRRLLTPTRPAIASPRGLDVVAEEHGVRLRWPAPDAEEATHARIYRRLGEDAAFPWQPWRVVESAEATLFDESASYGQTLVYGIAFGSASGEVAVESVPFLADAIEYADRFPPAAAEEVEAVSETARVRILWFPGGSEDEAYAAVERQREGESAWREVGRVDAPDTDFADASVELGVRYRYRVVAVDAHGNRSAPTVAERWASARAPLPEGENP